MKVTDLDYHLEDKLIKKLDIMLDRCTNPKKRRDALLLLEGSEGEGKTNASWAISYYLKYKTGREIHLFFGLKNLVQFAQETKNKIIIWDEPALDSLSTDWWKKANMDLIRLLMMCRKNRHFFIFNLTKFYKFSEYIVVDRALGLVHIYSRGETMGRFAYIKMKYLQNLFTDYKTKKRRNYGLYRNFGGGFTLVEKHLEKMGITIEGIKNCNLETYEKLKDDAIKSIGKTKPQEDVGTLKYKELKSMIARLKIPINTRKDLCSQLGIDRRTIYKWGKSDDNAKMSRGISRARTTAPII